MNVFLKSFLLAGIPFGITMGLFWGFMSNASIGTLSGIFLGCVFGFLISIFVHIQSKKFKKDSWAIVGNKEIYMEGAANHFMGMESVGGWLFLTKDEITFKSHNVNVQKHQMVIPLSQITEVRTSLTLGIVPNGLLVKTINTTEKFVVNKRKEWAKKINEAILYHNK